MKPMEKVEISLKNIVDALKAGSFTRYELEAISAFSSRLKEVTDKLIKRIDEK